MTHPLSGLDSGEIVILEHPIQSAVEGRDRELDVLGRVADTEKSAPAEKIDPFELHGNRERAGETGLAARLENLRVDAFGDGQIPGSPVRSGVIENDMEGRAIAPDRTRQTFAFQHRIQARP